MFDHIVEYWYVRICDAYLRGDSGAIIVAKRNFFHYVNLSHGVA